LLLTRLLQRATRMEQWVAATSCCRMSCMLYCIGQLCVICSGQASVPALASSASWLG
jgi:hypothetical protein